MSRIKPPVLVALGVVAIAAAFGLGVVTGHAGDDETTPTLDADSSLGPTGHQVLPVIHFTTPTTPAAKIEDALAALPAQIRDGARVVDYPAKVGDAYPELRAGTNEWTCFPDYAPSTGDDPACYNRAGMQWLDAYYAGKDPKLTEMGVIYRLRGGSDASLTDVTAAEPPPGAQWVLHGPHLVLIPIKGTDTSAYPTTPGDHPWVMWRGTDYEHIHLPVN